jgi:DMSO/TMAO reductase YedYZ molybdopterin-dependent catalytic subunit
MRLLLTVFSVALIGTSQGTVPFLAPSDPAQQVADTITVLRVAGDVDNPLSLTMADIAALPHEELVAEIHGRPVTYRGVKLSELLLLAGPPMGAHVVRTIVVARAADDYEAVFSLAELTPDFTDRIVLVADARDGESLPASEGPVRLVVPDEQEGARWVRLLREIEVRRLR